MALNVSVSISGPALSFVIYENVKCPMDQIGFLLGEAINHVTQSISDSHIHDEKMETLIRINSVLPIPHPASFYSTAKKIDRGKLHEFLKDKQKEVVGWYSFRRNCGLQPTFLNKSFHREICESLDHISPDLFAMCLLNTSAAGIKSTHAFNHKFVRWCNSKFEALPAQIHNLGLTQQTEYRVALSGTSESESFTKIVHSSMKNMKGRSDDVMANSMHKDLQDHLRNLIDETAQSEWQIADLEEAVNALRKHSGPISNEILLPELLQGSVSVSTPPTTSIESTSRNLFAQCTRSTPSQTCNNTSNKATTVMPNSAGTLLDTSTPPANNFSPVQSARKIKGEENKSPFSSPDLQANFSPLQSTRKIKLEENQSPDLFDFVETEMLSLSKPRKTPQVADIKRGGSAKVTGRGSKRISVNDGLPSVANQPAVALPPTLGYAQALKKSSNAAETVNQAVPVTRSKASHTNGSGD